MIGFFFFDVQVLAEVMEVMHEGHIKPGVSSPDQSVKDKADATWIRLQVSFSFSFFPQKGLL